MLREALHPNERVFFDGKPYRDAVCELWDALERAEVPDRVGVAQHQQAAGATAPLLKAEIGLQRSAEFGRTVAPRAPA
jgi:hypothetical protein